MPRDTLLILPVLKKVKITKSMPCAYFNQGTCSFPMSHDIKMVTHKHICVACFAKGGKPFPIQRIKAELKQIKPLQEIIRSWYGQLEIYPHSQK